MEKFVKLTSIAAPLAIDNVDTDMIIPKQFLKTIKRTGLSEGLFFEMRYNEDGSIVEDFVLHNAPFDKAQIIVSGENFGCGSSREHAPWALLDFGIRCVIAPSFADIFYNNCFKNGILPIKTEAAAEILEAASAGEIELTIDLEAQKIISGDKEYSFELDEFKKHCLLNGLDDISLSLQKAEYIDNYEGKTKQVTPWLHEAV